jgi:hypothetical protein
MGANGGGAAASGGTSRWWSGPGGVCDRVNLRGDDPKRRSEALNRHFRRSAFLCHDRFASSSINAEHVPTRAEASQPTTPLPTTHRSAPRQAFLHALAHMLARVWTARSVRCV